MDIKVEIAGRENVPERDRQSVTVETHHKRGDVYNVAKVDTMFEGDTVVFRVPGGGRLMLVTPEGENEVVYDPAQGAAVRRSSQQNEQGVADDPRTGDQRPATPIGARPVATGPDGSIKTVSQPATDPNRPQMRATTSQKPNEPNKFMSAADRAKAEAEAKAKAQQESGAGRPAGENPPKPGSPVGSPPDGNEGKGQ